MHCTKISPEFECQGQRSRSPETKRNSVAFCSGAVIEGIVLRQFYAGGKIRACCLVVNLFRSLINL